MSLYEKACNGCGRIFPARQKRTAWCGPKCYRQAHRKPKAVCIDCGAQVGYRRSKRCDLCAKKRPSRKRHIYAPIDCVNCGVEFTPTHGSKKHCSAPCRWRVIHKPIYCLGCGVEFVPQNGKQKYCTKECWYNDYLNKIRQNPAVCKERAALKRICRNVRFRPNNKHRCSVCSSIFYRKHRPCDAHKAPCCSKKCSTKMAADAASARWLAINAGEQKRTEAELADEIRGALYLKDNPHLSRLGWDASAHARCEIALIRHMAGNWFKTCEGCGKGFLTRRNDHVFCCAVCQEGAKPVRQWERLSKGRVSTCLNCGVQYCFLHGYDNRLGQGKWSYCSFDCREVYRKRTGVVRGRGSNLNKRRVHDACNWTCQACGCGTPRRLQGTFNDNAPEADHIVAQAKGGNDSYDNLHTLCRLCNRLKSDTDWKEFMGDRFPNGRTRPVQRLLI